MCQKSLCEKSLSVLITQALMRKSPTDTDTAYERNRRCLVSLRNGRLWRHVNDEITAG